MALIKTFKASALPVIEGVVARGRNEYAISMKKSNGNILLDKGGIKFISQLPLIFIRGIISLFEVGSLTCKTFIYSADYFDKEERSSADTELFSREEYLNRQDQQKAENAQSWLAFSGILVLLLVAIVALFILPVFISSLFFDNVRDENWMLFNVVECASRLILLVLYFVVFKVSGGVFKKLRQYHSAANKAINCLESGIDVSYDNAKVASSFHPRAVPFILFLTVIICSVALIFIKMEGLLFALLIRLGILILSINVAYEISRLLGMFNGKFSRAVAMIFGMWIVGLTVSEPDDMQLYVATTAVRNAMIEGE